MLDCFYQQHPCPVWWMFLQPIGFPMDINCALLLAWLFLKGFQKNKFRKLAQIVACSFFSSGFGDYLNLIYQNELDVNNNSSLFIFIIKF
jgi:hypothetical protein